MNDREAWVLGSETLLKLLRDDLVLARAMLARRADVLLAVATIANGGLSDRLALTDPTLYRRLRSAITLFHLKGYGALRVDVLRALDAPRTA